MLGFPRVTDNNLAYLYVMSWNSGLSKIGVSGDLAQRIYIAWSFTAPIGWLHGGILLPRETALKIERDIRLVDKTTNVPHPTNGALTDWFQQSPDEIIRIIDSVLYREHLSASAVWYRPAINISDTRYKATGFPLASSPTPSPVGCAVPPEAM